MRSLLKWKADAVNAEIDKGVPIFLYIIFCILINETYNGIKN